MMVEPGDATHQPEREVEQEDYDLLTFAEAGERLAAELAHERALLARLVDAGAVADAVEVAARLRRIADLEAAAERNRRQPLTDATFERFFGYPPGGKPGDPVAPTD
ncbi:hypothetical protein BJF78_14330 [Pseudonocardia sp. CNS-139]|nr:hypothetical protein BJF78_14330 [Pseudonocardia sp. CNS-139]